MEIVIALVASFLGSLGFGVILQAPRASLFNASLIGGISYLCYWGIVQAGAGEASAMFCGAAVGSLLAQLAARRMHMVATIFITIAIIPLVPGLGLYRTMQYFAQGMSALGAETGIRTLLNILMLALGIGVGSFIFKIRKRAR